MIETVVVVSVIAFWVLVIFFLAPLFVVWMLSRD